MGSEAVAMTTTPSKLGNSKIHLSRYAGFFIGKRLVISAHCFEDEASSFPALRDIFIS